MSVRNTQQAESPTKASGSNAAPEATLSMMKTIFTKHLLIFAECNIPRNNHFTWGRPSICCVITYAALWQKRLETPALQQFNRAMYIFILRPLEFSLHSHCGAPVPRVSVKTLRSSSAHQLAREENRRRRHLEQSRRPLPADRVEQARPVRPSQRNPGFARRLNRRLRPTRFYRTALPLKRRSAKALNEPRQHAERAPLPDVVSL